MVLEKKDYENIILRNDKFTEDTEIALGLVKKYVIENIMHFFINNHHTFKYLFSRTKSY